MQSAKIPPRDKIIKKPSQKQSQKRKRSSDCPEDSEVESLKDKRHKVCTDDYGDDDDDDEGPYIMKESTDTKAMESDVPQDRPARSQTHEQVAAAIASLDLHGKVAQGDNKLADQQRSIRGTAKPDSDAPNALADTFRQALLSHIIEWANYASSLKRGLEPPAGKLLTAKDTGEIVIASQNILQHLSSFHKRVQTIRLLEQQVLEAVKANGISVDTLPGHQIAVAKYGEMEREFEVVIEEMTKQIDEVRTALL